MAVSSSIIISSSMYVISDPCRPAVFVCRFQVTHESRDVDSCRGSVNTAIQTETLRRKALATLVHDRCRMLW